MTRLFSLIPSWPGGMVCFAMSLGLTITASGFLLSSAIHLSAQDYQTAISHFAATTVLAVAAVWVL